MPKVTDVIVFESSDDLAIYAVDLLEQVVREHVAPRIGTATGGTMAPVYNEIARRCSFGDLSLAHAEFFQLDEYYPIDPAHAQSYHTFLKTHLLSVTDAAASSLHVPNGGASDPQAAVKAWDEQLTEGPLNLQFLGIGVEGHIAFVEAGEAGQRTLRDSRTMVVDLDESTLRENARFFPPGSQQPTQAMTVGIGTLLEVVEHFVLVANGSKKAPAIAAALLDDVEDRCPASYIREGKGKTSVLLDQEAAAELLSRIKKLGRTPAHLSIAKADPTRATSPSNADSVESAEHAAQ